jgi:CheY-like chemotaxis protein
MTANEYIKALGGHPKLILIEDDQALRESYSASLERAGFQVVAAAYASQLPAALGQCPDVNVILSDTDTGDSFGDEEVGKLLEQGLIKESVLILAMSDLESNQDHWVGIAHHAGFFSKERLRDDMGQRIVSHYYDFQVSCSPLWRERLRSCDEG